MRFSSLLHGAFPVLTLAALVTCACLLARGLGRLTQTLVGDRQPLATRPNSSRDVPLIDAHRENADSLQVRAAFGSRRAALPVVLDRGFLSAPDCDAIAVHIVTESPDRLWSLASLSVAGEPRPHLCRVGDRVAGHRVEFIGYNPRQASAAVWLSNPTRICQASIAAGTKVPAEGNLAERTLDSPPEIAANVQPLSDTEHNLSRAAFGKLYENLLELAQHIKAVPEMSDGRRVGVRLFGVRPGTWLSALGVQNGDRIESINGFNLAEPEKLMEAYARLRTASELNVKLTRRGAPAELAVHIR